MTIQELNSEIGQDWESVTTASKLKRRLINATVIMDQIGMTALSRRWRERIKNMPLEMDKESINIVLLSACKEVKQQFN